jgi:hypothetical protein
MKASVTKLWFILQIICIVLIFIIYEQDHIVWGISGFSIGFSVFALFDNYFLKPKKEAS